MIKFKLGDLVEKILYYTGIKWSYEKYKVGPCEACQRRKEYLNKLNNRND